MQVSRTAGQSEAHLMAHDTVALACQGATVIVTSEIKIQLSHCPLIAEVLLRVAGYNKLGDQKLVEGPSILPQKLEIISNRRPS
jgi:hypothetical protein